MRQAFSTILLFSGVTLLIFGAYLLYLRQSPKTLTFKSIPQSTNSLSFSAPQSLEVPSISVKLPVIPAVHKGNNWETTHHGVSYLSTSAVPGQKGNSVFYGHNWEGLLANLYKVKPGEKVLITMQDGTRKVFEIEYTAIVNPSDTYIIENTQDSRITLYTCAGFLDSKRFVVVAKPTI